MRTVCSIFQRVHAMKLLCKLLTYCPADSIGTALNGWKRGHRFQFATCTRGRGEVAGEMRYECSPNRPGVLGHARMSSNTAPPPKQ